VTDDYDPALIDLGPSVIVLDDLTNQIDNRAGVTVRRAVDEPIIQSVMAAGYGAVADAAMRLAARPDASWIACASSRHNLAQCLGDDVATNLVEAAQVINLPARPRPGTM